MSMLSEQCARLRSWAAQFDDRADLDVLAPLLARDLREAADTIISLRDRLQAAELGSGTCELHYGEDDDGYDGWYCDGCGGWFQAVRRDEHLVKPKHCQECGKAVKR